MSPEDGRVQERLEGRRESLGWTQPCSRLANADTYAEGEGAGGGSEGNPPSLGRDTPVSSDGDRLLNIVPVLWIALFHRLY